MPMPQSCAPLSRFRQEKAVLLAQFQTEANDTRRIDSQLKALSKLADQYLLRLWQQHQLPTTCALVASGGFGREALFPYSDIDVLLLLPNGADPENDADLKGHIESFVGACWDEGLDIGSAVRTLNQCLAESQTDISIQTALLESRLIGGNAILFHQFQKEFRDTIKPRAFLEQKTAEMRYFVYILFTRIFACLFLSSLGSRRIRSPCFSTASASSMIIS